VGFDRLGATGQVAQNVEIVDQLSEEEQAPIDAVRRRGSEGWITGERTQQLNTAQVTGRDLRAGLRAKARSKRR
jgi:hypothetical protein